MGSMTRKTTHSGRWGKPYHDHRNWPEYNEQLVLRGTFLFDLDFREQWDQELRRMNEGKRGAPYRFPDSFMTFLLMWHQFLDYRGLEGLARSLVKAGVLPAYGDYTTVWHRVHAKKPALKVSGLSYAEVGTDGTGLKTNNAGSYRILKYGDPDAARRKHLIVTITADVRTKKIIGVDVHIEGKGHSEASSAMRHIQEAVGKGIHIGKFYGDGAFDTAQMFSALQATGTEPVIKIRKNAQTWYRHSPGRDRWARRRAVRAYRKLGYRAWADQKGYGMRWPGTEGIFSAVKRKFGENTLSRSRTGLEAEGYQRFWIYDHIKGLAEAAVEAKRGVAD